jgi:hypothetical protein
MLQIGRVLSVLGILSFVFLLSLSSASVRAAVSETGPGHWAASIAGAIGSICVFIPWALAVYHWGTRYEGSPRSRRRWGIGLIAGGFVAAWIYWLRPISEQQ